MTTKPGRRVWSSRLFPRCCDDQEKRLLAVAAINSWGGIASVARSKHSANGTTMQYTIDTITKEGRTSSGGRILGFDDTVCVRYDCSTKRVIHRITLPTTLMNSSITTSRKAG